MRHHSLSVQVIHEGGRVCFHTSHQGPQLPRHLQVAFGRGVFRLLHGSSHPTRTAFGLTHGLVYLRDLPLNLADLARRGFPHALEAYRAECHRTHRTPAL
ncbi:MAG: hypothetical protein KGR26_11415 [Cyanobacteria bacterium REEB65]|nr:hypothetical protein [Cyanobacteria bacterium REEB65]